MSLCRIVEFTPDTVGEFAEAVTKAASRGRKRVDPDLSRSVAKIIESVRRSGWRAAIRLTRKFGCPTLKANQFEVKKKELKSAELPKHHHAAILTSIGRVTEFHQAQLKALTAGWKVAPLNKGTMAWRWQINASNEKGAGFEGQRLLPLESAGVYVPGGKADYPSSVIMNAVPAIVTGVERLMICTPPRSDGSISPAVLVAARELGIETIVKCGGAQAIALMALGPFGEKGTGSQSWLPGDKIVGPGNKWVNEAKRQLWGHVGLDTFAGPSEVCVVADESADPKFAAADWLTQVEHADDNVGYVVATTRDVADRIMAEAEKQLMGTPREATMRKALMENGLVLVIDRPSWANVLAAEHVSLMVKDPERVLENLRDGGCVLLGDTTPQSAGDFCSGPSHTLPTGGAARFSSPVNVMDFLKFQSISSLTKEDLRGLLPTIEAFGEMEGFPQHARGASIRFET